MLKQKAILAAVISLIETKYAAVNAYTDEITKSFKQPCFFVKLIKRRGTETKNITSNSISVVLTYFADGFTNKQLAFLDCEDVIDELFGNGFFVGERYLHIKNIASERIGENQDILQITVDIDYLDTTGYDGNAGYDMMQKVNMNITNE
jgi:hypothetical protein